MFLPLGDAWLASSSLIYVLPERIECALWTLVRETRVREPTEWFGGRPGRTLRRTLRGMAARGWGGSIATAVGVGAGAGAAQLGLGYGLGIIAWPPSAGGAGESAWVASLAWATWIAATSAVAGAIVADRLGPTAMSTLERRSSGMLATSLWRAALALAAAIGALVTVPLVAVPARAVNHPETSSPQTIAGAYAVIGVLIGLLAAVAALTSRAIAANVIASVTWLWLLAIVAVTDGVAAGHGLVTAQLGEWEFTGSGPIVKNIDVPRALLTLCAALLIGALAALPAARRGDSGIGVSISGAIGPLLVAAAYFLAAPKLSGSAAAELSAHLVAPYAVIAGLAGSVVIAGFGPRLQRRPTPVPVVPAQARAAGSLPDNAYAPAGAHGSEPEAARGAASVKTPLWPEAKAAAATTTDADAKGPSHLRGKQGRSRD